MTARIEKVAKVLWNTAKDDHDPAWDRDINDGMRNHTRKCARAAYRAVLEMASDRVGVNQRLSARDLIDEFIKELETDD